MSEQTNYPARSARIAIAEKARALPLTERWAASLGAILVALRLLQEGQWLPLVLIAVLATGYPFLGPSARAALTFLVGPVALVGALLAILDAHWNGFTPGQLPGLALLVGGIALLVVSGAALLSRPRVRTARRIGRAALTLLGAILILYYGVTPLGAALWITSKPRIPVRTFAVPHREVVLMSGDGVRLAAWYVPSKNGAAIVVVHGGGGSRDGLKLHATMLARNGYGVLLYDERGRGESGGRTNGLGWDWPADVDAAVAFLRGQGARRVGVLGLSTGAEVALTSAAENPRIAAVVADGAEARTLDDFAHQHGADKWTSLPYWAVTTFAVRVIRHTKPPEPLDEVMRRIAPRPLLLVQSNDPAETALAPVWARIDGRPGVLWHVDAAHTKGLATQPAEYRRRVLGLFDAALLER